MAGAGRVFFATLVLALVACGPSGHDAPPGAGANEDAAVRDEAVRDEAVRDGAVRDEAVRDVVLISVDTLRHDTLGYAGHEVATPAIDRLAARGRVFTGARAHAVMTTPSHMSMLTGLEPHRHGVRDNGGFVLGDDVPTLPELLRRQGFATGGFVGAYPLAAEKGFGRGFEVYDDLEIDAETSEDLLLGLPNPRAGVGQRSGEEVVSAALDWWRDAKDRRRFLFVHVYDPHAPYDPPAPFRGRYADPYVGEVAWTDHLLGPLLEALEEESERVLVIFTSDHGEAFGEHGEPTHGFFAYESTLRVPLVLAGAGVEPGRDERNARHVDLVPTILDAAGVGSGEAGELPGRSLLEGAAAWAEAPTYFESLSPFFNFGFAPLRGVVVGRHKVIEQPLAELYDLEADPAEAENLVDEERATARRLLELLPPSGGYGLEERSLEEEERARLAALGYLDARRARGESMADFSAEDDLKNALDAYKRLRDVVAWLHDGRHDDVVSAARELESRVPDSPLLYSTWAAALIRRGDSAAGVEVIRRAIDRDAAGADLRRQLGISLMQLGRLGEAVDALRREAERVPSDMTLNVLGHAYLRGGDAAGSQAAFERAAQLFPESPRAFENLSFLRLQLGDAEGAERYARHALELREELPGAWNNLGLALYEQGLTRQALDAWGRALEIEPENPNALFNHGLVASSLGEEKAGRESLRRFLDVVGGEPGGPGDPRVAEARRLLAQLDG